MKKAIVLLLAAALLCGCAVEPRESAPAVSEAPDVSQYAASLQEDLLQSAAAVSDGGKDDPAAAQDEAFRADILEEPLVKDVSPTASGTWQFRDEKYIWSITDFIAKCTVVREPQIVKVQYINPDREKAYFYSGLYTVKIERVLYTNGAEKDGDVVKIYMGNIAFFRTPDGDKICKYEDCITPETGESFYILCGRMSPGQADDGTLRAAQETAKRKITDLYGANEVSVMLQVQDGRYECEWRFAGIVADRELHSGIRAKATVGTVEEEMLVNGILREISQYKQ